MNSKDPNHRKESGARPLVVVATVVVAVVVIAGGLMMFRSKPVTAPSAGQEAASTTSGTSEAGTGSGKADATAVPPNSIASAAESASKPSATAIAGQSVAALVKILKDPSKSMDERKKAIRTLAQMGTPEALAALKEVLANGSADMRVAVAEGLGECSTPECYTALVSLLDDPNKDIVKAAIRGLATQGSPQAIEMLSKMLYDNLRSGELRSAAAEGLGNVKGTAAFEVLSRAALTMNDPDLITDVLTALGTREFSETGSFFQNYLRSSAPSELRIAAVEALAHTQGDPTSLLLEMAADQDADVRASAAWALSATDESGNAAAQLLSLVRAEQDPDVRLRLYQALGNQSGVDVSAALAAVRTEQDASAKVAGLSLIAKLLRDSPTLELQNYFDQYGAPYLKEIAMSGPNADRMPTVIALIRANTPSAQAALQDLARNAPDPRVREAAYQALQGFAGFRHP